MPHETESPVEAAVEAVERVAHAVEKASESDPPPSSKGKPPSRLKQWAAFFTSIAALLASGGAFLKTCDHSITQNAYNTLSGEITKVDDKQQRDHEDLVKLQGYLDGLARAPVVPIVSPSASMAVSTIDAGAPPVGTIRPWPPATTHPSATAAAGNPDGGLVTFAIIAPPLPSVQASGKPVRPPPWAQVAAGK